MGRFKNLTLDNLERDRLAFFDCMYVLNCIERRQWGDTPYKDLNTYIHVVGVDFLMDEWIAYEDSNPS